MDEATMRQRVAVARVGRLATTSRSARPDLVPFCFTIDADTLYSAVDEKPKTTTRLRRLDNIRSHPEVTVLIDHYEEDWTKVWWVRLRGTGRVVEAGAEWDRAIRLLQDKYAQYRDAPPRGPAIVILVHEWRGWPASG